MLQVFQGIYSHDLAPVSPSSFDLSWGLRLAVSNRPWILPRLPHLRKTLWALDCSLSLLRHHNRFDEHKAGRTVAQPSPSAAAVDSTWHCREHPVGPEVPRGILDPIADLLTIVHWHMFDAGLPGDCSIRWAGATC